MIIIFKTVDATSTHGADNHFVMGNQLSVHKWYKIIVQFLLHVIHALPALFIPSYSARSLQCQQRRICRYFTLAIGKQ
jgi:hypothetical protein